MVSALSVFGFQENRENTEFIMKFRKKLFFNLFDIRNIIKDFDSGFHGFGINRIIVFQITKQKTNLQGNYGNLIFIILNLL